MAEQHDDPLPKDPIDGFSSAYRGAWLLSGARADAKEARARARFQQELADIADDRADELDGAVLRLMNAMMEAGHSGD